jgi:hypothetical protein
VEAREDVLVHRLHRHGADAFVANGLEQTLCVRAVGLVAQHVGAHRMRREKDDAMAARIGLAPPEVCRPAGLHHDRGRSLIGEETRELPPREPAALRHVPRPPRYRDLENGLRQIHRDRRRLHLGLLLPGAFRGARRLWHADAARVAGGVHLITEADGRGPRRRGGHARHVSW